MNNTTPATLSEDTAQALRFITCGSVDDGKSTLIGRLLYDTDSILADQLEAIQNANRKNDDGTVDLAILTDGLRAEREQGITIDVAYRFLQENPLKKREQKIIFKTIRERIGYD